MHPHPHPHPHPLLLFLLLLLPLTHAYSGTLTAYTPSAHSFCGITAHSYDAVVAISPSMMGGAPPPHNAKCGSIIGIYNPATGRKHEAYVVDVCAGCGHENLQGSQGLFDLVVAGKEAVGGVRGVDWGGERVGG